MTHLGFWDTNESPNIGQKARPYNNQPKKNRTCKIVDFVVLAVYRVNLKEREKKDKYLHLARESEKTVENKSDGYNNGNCSHQRIIKGTGGFGNNRTSRDHQNYCIIEINRNLKRSRGDLLSLKLQWMLNRRNLTQENFHKGILKRETESLLTATQNIATSQSKNRQDATKHHM